MIARAVQDGMICLGVAAVAVGAALLTVLLVLAELLASKGRRGRASR